MTRTAISPRLAMRIFSSTAANVGSGRCPRSTVRRAARGAGRHGRRRRGHRAGTSSTSPRPGARTTTCWRSAGERPDRSVLVADYQHAGRGRRDRSVDGDARGRTCSSRSSSTTCRRRRWSCPVACRLATVDACRRFTGAPLALKWPNDVLLDDRKLAGVLAQRTADGSVVVGIGVNVGWAPDGAAGWAGRRAAAICSPSCSPPTTACRRRPHELRDRYRQRAGDARPACARRAARRRAARRRPPISPSTGASSSSTTPARRTASASATSSTCACE